MVQSMDSLYVVHDSRFGSVVRPLDGRIKPSDPRWEKARLLERLSVPVELIDGLQHKNPPPGAKVVWFALPDPQPFWTIKHYDHWRRLMVKDAEEKGTEFKCINHPFETFRMKDQLFNFLNANGVRCPIPTYKGIFRKTVFHGYGPEFGVEYVHSIGANPDEGVANANRSKYNKVWRMVVFNGKCSKQCARLEGNKFWVGTGCAEHFKDMVPTPPPYVEISEKVAELLGMGYFQIEIIPSPWVGPVVCDINPHSFDVMEGQLNDSILPYINETLTEWLS